MSLYLKASKLCFPSAFFSSGSLLSQSWAHNRLPSACRSLLHELALEFLSIYSSREDNVCLCFWNLHSRPSLFFPKPTFYFSKTKELHFSSGNCHNLTLLLLLPMLKVRYLQNDICSTVNSFYLSWYIYSSFKTLSLSTNHIFLATSGQPNYKIETNITATWSYYQLFQGIAFLSSHFPLDSLCLSFINTVWRLKLTGTAHIKTLPPIKMDDF